jgi:hypothetical protein
VQILSRKIKKVMMGETSLVSSSRQLIIKQEFLLEVEDVRDFTRDEVCESEEYNIPETAVIW